MKRLSKAVKKDLKRSRSMEQQHIPDDKEIKQEHNRFVRLARSLKSYFVPLRKPRRRK